MSKGDVFEPSLRCLVAFHNYPEHFQWLRNANYHFWLEAADEEYDSEEINLLVRRWRSFRFAFDDMFPYLSGDIDMLVADWDQIDEKDAENEKASS